MKLKIYSKELNNNNKLFTELQSINGIGNKKAFLICNLLGVPRTIKISQLSLQKQSELKNIFYENKNLIVDKKLNFLIRENIKTKITLKRYQGLRHKYSLPVRGQRTKSNSKTQRKKQNKTKKKKH